MTPALFQPRRKIVNRCTRLRLSSVEIHQTRLLTSTHTSRPPTKNWMPQAMKNTAPTLLFAGRSNGLYRRCDKRGLTSAVAGNRLLPTVRRAF
jgi:hypothetical protein